MDSKETIREKAKWELHKNATCQFEQIQEAAPHKTTSVRPLISHITNHPEEAKKNSLAMFSHGFLHMDTPVLTKQQRLIYISSVQTLDAVKRTYQERWQIGMDVERVSRESVLSTQLDDYYRICINNVVCSIYK